MEPVQLLKGLSISYSDDSVWLWFDAPPYRSGLNLRQLATDEVIGPAVTAWLRAQTLQTVEQSCAEVAHAAVWLRTLLDRRESQSTREAAAQRVLI